MELEIQIQSFVASFVFGLLFSYVVNLCYKWLFFSKGLFRFLFTLIFVLFFCLLYFIMMVVINSARIHIYFFMMTLIGYLIGNLFSRKVRYH